MSELDRLAELYEQRLGGGTLDSPSPEPMPEAADFSGMAGAQPVEVMPLPTTDIVFLGTGDASLAGMNVRLSEEDVEAIVKIVAAAVAREAEGNLNEWRKRFSLQQEG